MALQFNKGRLKGLCVTVCSSLHVLVTFLLAVFEREQLILPHLSLGRAVDFFVKYLCSIFHNNTKDVQKWSSPT